MLGDNPFIGVSHLAQEKAREERSAASLENKVRVFEAAARGGATGFTFTTDESNLELLTYLNNHREDLLKEMSYYILVPHAQLYIRQANLEGTISLVKSTLGRIFCNHSLIPDILAATSSLRPEKLAGPFIMNELCPYLSILPHNRVKAVLLHEVLTEITIAFNLFDLVRFLDNYVRERAGLSFGLETRNLGHLYRRMLSNNYHPEFLMTPINPMGYQMSPDKKTVEKVIREAGGASKIIAINILASGAIDLSVALDYLKQYEEQIYAITSASVSPERICQNFVSICKAFSARDVARSR